MEQVKLLSMTVVLTALVWASADSLVNEAITGYLEEFPGIPKVQGEACYITYGAKWTYLEKEMELKPRNYVLQANKWTTFDAYLGKARRRMLRDVYRMITGLNFGLSEEGETDRGMRNVTPKTKGSAAETAGSSISMKGAAS